MICDYKNGVYAFDAHYERKGLVSIYIVADCGRAAIVDTAHNRALPYALAALKELGIPRENVDYVLLSHVHLDHAGGAGLFMQRLPNAKLVVHPRGARHMIDPSRLLAGAGEVYGAAEIARMYGTVIPVPPSRVLTPQDGCELPLGGRVVACLETPGHARHHMAYFDRTANAVFTGDAFGTTRKRFDAGGPCAFPMTTPTQFDPVAMHRSIDRIAALKPAAAYPTHFGRMSGTEQIAADLHRMIDGHVSAVTRAGGNFERTCEALGELFEEERIRQSWPIAPGELRSALEIEIRLNALGLCAWYIKV